MKVRPDLNLNVSQAIIKAGSLSRSPSGSTPEAASAGAFLHIGA